MTRGTTPEYMVSISGYDLMDKTVYVTISQGENQITKTGDDLEIWFADSTSTILFTLSQVDTLSFKEGDARIQVRFIDQDGIARATKIGTVPVHKVLLNEVIDYVGSY